MPLGKFDSDRDELFYVMSLEGWANESSGDVECPTGYFARISNGRSDIPSIRDAFPEESRPVSDDEIVGHYLLQENSQGFVSVYDYASEWQLTRAFRILEETYSEWTDDE
ncbi:hypothetical protein SEA_CIRCINUS_249 [Streptomyces phage Circinus]|uniref:Uncharacterized protein n=1 Tax=Streptomyces phage Circinus TaxID=2562189 RepID=A0A4D6E372_9CAUD|nr:hypothetical protein SEA_CIRCINUS_4 [Streptomyces phage Circinus]QBZ72502.1 hypothetical protein SEA_CIRCINUS_249 [Streptomyces phage Circinus]